MVLDKTGLVQIYPVFILLRKLIFLKVMKQKLDRNRCRTGGKTGQWDSYLGGQGKRL